MSYSRNYETIRSFYRPENAKCTEYYTKRVDDESFSVKNIGDVNRVLPVQPLSEPKYIPQVYNFDSGSQYALTAEYTKQPTLLSYPSTTNTPYPSTTNTPYPSNTNTPYPSNTNTPYSSTTNTPYTGTTNTPYPSTNIPYIGTTQYPHFTTPLLPQPTSQPTPYYTETPGVPVNTTNQPTASPFVEKSITLEPEITWSEQYFDSTSAPDVFGPPLWFNLHNGASKYPDNPSSITQERMKNFIISLPVMIPCENCQEHATNYIEKHRSQLSHICASRNNLFKFFFDFHNFVNKRLNKPEMSYDDAIRLYSGKIKVKKMSYGK